jgi:hypothetical protein
MDTQAIDGYSRQDLWAWQEQHGHFDWCRKEEYAQLQALFFDGVVQEFPEEFITCRQLFMSPLQGEPHWRSVLEARSRFRHVDTQEIFTSTVWGEEFAQKSLCALLGRDQQTFGMSVDDQVGLIDFLGFERIHPLDVQQHLHHWVAEMWLWLQGKALGGDLPLIPGLTDTRGARLTGLMYRLLAQAPLGMKGKRLVLTEERRGWSDHQAGDLQGSLKLLFPHLENYRVPKKLPSDPSRRLQFVEAMRRDLEPGGAAPQILRDAWVAWQSRPSKSR